MDTDAPTEIQAKLRVQELHIPYDSCAFKGKLLVATPFEDKPRNVAPLQWRSAILANRVCKESHLVIPLSFWLPYKPAHQELPSTSEFSRFYLVDEVPFDGENYSSDTPFDSIRRIIDCLKKGENVLALSATPDASGFLPAVLARVIDPNIHIVKLWWPIVHGNDYLLTPFQVGYLYGLTDAEFRSETESIREN